MRHSIDPYPIPREHPIFINEPWLIDPSKMPETLDEVKTFKEPDSSEGNVRVYVPLDLNHDAILRRLDYVIGKYGEASEENEFDFSQDVRRVIDQLEIFERVHYVRNIPADLQASSEEGRVLAKDIISRLEAIPDACAETFPFELIDELRAEYLT